jgi:hypothetical protein
LKRNILMTISPDWPSKMAIQSLAHELGQIRVPEQARSLDVLHKTIETASPPVLLFSSFITLYFIRLSS